MMSTDIPYCGKYGLLNKTNIDFLWDHCLNWFSEKSVDF